MRYGFFNNPGWSPRPGGFLLRLLSASTHTVQAQWSLSDMRYSLRSSHRYAFLKVMFTVLKYLSTTFLVFGNLGACPRLPSSVVSLRYTCTGYAFPLLSSSIWILSVPSISFANLITAEHDSTTICLEAEVGQPTWTPSTRTASPSWRARCPRCSAVCRTSMRSWKCS